MKEYGGYKDLIVYQKSRCFGKGNHDYTLRSFPKEEKYALIDQVIRSSRAIGANITEAWAKRRYTKSFVAKLIDSQGEAFETSHWLEIALENNYISKEIFQSLEDLCIELQKMLESMINQPNKFCK
jgi:four helix bundle protein